MRANTIQRITIISALLLASTIVVHAVALDGTQWKVKVVPDKASAEKGAKTFNDEWTFADGKFTSAAMKAHGFEPTSKIRLETEETVVGELREAEFQIEQFRATNDVAVWTGDIRGTNAVGGLQWKAKDRDDFLYDFTGTRE